MINILKGWQMKKSVALILIGAVWLISIVSVRALSREVDINVDNSTISTRTFSNETGEILNQAGVKLKPNDSVNRHEDKGRLTLDVKRAFSVVVLKNNQKIMLEKSSGTVKSVLDELDISEKDRTNLNYSESEDLFPDIEIVVGKKIKIVVNADGESKEHFVPEGTVNDAINYLGIALSSNDLVEPNISSEVFDGMNLTISRITYRESKKTEDIPFETETKSSGLLNHSERRISRKGKKGLKELVVRETLKDGKVVDSKEINSKIISQPVKELVLIGTVSPSSNSKARSVSCASKGEKCICGSATAYTASKGAKTATGVTPVEGVTIAVDPKVIPYGTPIRIETNEGKVLYNGKAQDTGPALKSGSALVDVYMSSTSKCIKFGRKNVRVYYRI